MAIRLSLGEQVRVLSTWNLDKCGACGGEGKYTKRTPQSEWKVLCRYCRATGRRVERE